MAVIRSRGRDGLKASFDYVPGVNTSSGDTVKKRLEIELQHDPNTQLASNLDACKELAVTGVDNFVRREKKKKPDETGLKPVETELLAVADKALVKAASREVKYKKPRPREEQ